MSSFSQSKAWEKDALKITDKTAKYRTEIGQMMFVSGETSEPSQETTTLIESIVQEQVIEMLKRGTELAARRGTRSITVDDLIFLIRHDKAKVSRLRTFLSWKDVRKSAKDSDDKPGGGDDLADDAFIGGSGGGGAGAANPADAAAKMNKHRKAKVRLPWDVHSYYQITLPDREDEEDEEEEEMTAATLQRLQNADERTRGMTRGEYVHFSECRQASFTFRKGKRFREWAGFGIVTDSKPNDDIVDILGFLTFEIVQTITEEALKVKQEEDAFTKMSGSTAGNTAEGEGLRKRKRESNGLFDPPEEEKTPVEPRHVREAFRRSQVADKKTRALGHFEKNPIRRSLKLI